MIAMIHDCSIVTVKSTVAAWPIPTQGSAVPHQHLAGSPRWWLPVFTPRRMGPAVPQLSAALWPLQLTAGPACGGVCVGSEIMLSNWSVRYIIDIITITSITPTHLHHSRHSLARWQITSVRCMRNPREAVKGLRNSPSFLHSRVISSLMPIVRITTGVVITPPDHSIKVWIGCWKGI